MTELGGKKMSSQTGSEVNIPTAQPRAAGGGWHCPGTARLGLCIPGQRRTQLVLHVQNRVMSDLGKDAWPCRRFMETLGMSKETCVSPPAWREGHAVSWESGAAPGQATLTEPAQRTQPGDHSKELQVEGVQGARGAPGEVRKVPQEFLPKAAACSRNDGHATRSPCWHQLLWPHKRHQSAPTVKSCRTTRPP